MYDDYSDKLKKAHMFTKGLKQKEEENARKIKLSFWFLVGVAIFIILRRMLFPGCYRSLFNFF